MADDQRCTRGSRTPAYPVSSGALVAVAGWLALALGCSRPDLEPDGIVRTIDGQPSSGAEVAVRDLRRIGWTRKGAGPCTCRLTHEFLEPTVSRTAATISCPEGPEYELHRPDDRVTLSMTIRHFATGPWTTTTTWDERGIHQRAAADVEWVETWRAGTEVARGTGQALVQLLAPVPYQEGSTVLVYPVILEAVSVWRDESTPSDDPPDGEIERAWVYCLEDL